MLVSEPLEPDPFMPEPELVLEARPEASVAPGWLPLSGCLFFLRCAAPGKFLLLPVALSGLAGPVPVPVEDEPSLPVLPELPLPVAEF